MPFMNQALPALSASSKGVLICGGGQKYIPSLWVCLNMLRHWGCSLPVEVWHLGGQEITPEQELWLREKGAVCVDATIIRHRHPCRTLNGYELKAFALRHSQFEEVLLLDADNVPVQDPTFLFNTMEYQRSGAIFWPDYGRLERERSIWELAGIPYRDEPEFESGQMVVDRRRHLDALELSLLYNEFSDVYYQHIHGDKDTFHLAWRKLGKEYAMPDRGIHNLSGLVMCQHDFASERLFQHRNMDKWRLDSENEAIPDFWHEDLCRGFLADLRARLNAQPLGSLPQPPAGETAEKAKHDLMAHYWNYVRRDHDERMISFLPNGQIGAGRGNNELHWKVAELDGQPVLEVSGEGRLTFRCFYQPDGTWTGSWEHFEQMSVEVRAPEPLLRTDSRVVAVNAAPLRSSTTRGSIVQVCRSLGQLNEVSEFALRLEAQLRAIGWEVVSTSTPVRRYDGGLLIYHHEPGADADAPLGVQSGDASLPELFFSHAGGNYAPAADDFAAVVSFDCQFLDSAPHKCKFGHAHPGWYGTTGRSRVETRSLYGLRQDQIVYGTSGFFLPERQLLPCLARLLPMAAAQNALLWLHLPRHEKTKRSEMRELEGLAKSYPHLLKVDTAFQTPDDLHDWMKACNALWTWSEGGGAVTGSCLIADMLATGRPVVVGGCDYLDPGWKFSSPNLVRVLTMEELCLRLGAVGNPSHSPAFPEVASWQEFAEAFSSFLERLLAHPTS